MKSLILGLSLVIFFGDSVQATNRQVTSLEDDNSSGTLRAVVTASGNGDSITFNVTGTIDLLNGEIVVFKNLTITGPGATNLTISGFGLSRVFNFQSGTTNSVSGLRIANGRNIGAAGADISYDCNSAPFPKIVTPKLGGLGSGGGVYNSGNLTFNDCVFTGNLALGGSGGSGMGGNYYCNPVNNGPLGDADGAQGGDAYGGAIFSNGKLSLTRCTFNANAVTAGAGGVGENDFPYVIPVDYHPDPNLGVYGGGSGGNARGGAVYLQGTGQFFNCTFTGNAATGGSGGSANDNYGADTNNPSNGGNGGDAAGAAIYMGGSSISIFNNTISGNTTFPGDPGFGLPVTTGTNGLPGNTYAGGIQVSSGTVLMGSSIVALNISSIPEIGGAVSSQGFNLIGKLDGSSGWINSDITGTIASPVDPLLGSLQNNGGQTPTLELLNGSPAIDAGLTLLSTDQRGLPRVDFPMVPNHAGGDGSDIGAFESQKIILDVGLRVFDGVSIKKLAGEYPASSPLRISKNGYTYGVLLTATNAINASKFRVAASAGMKSIQKLP